MNKLKYLSLFFLLPLIGCEELFFEDVPSDEPISIFEQTWNFADQEYSFFDIKQVDWDAVYDEFKPKIQNDMSEEALFDTLANMLFVLRDGHVNLRSNFDRSRNWEWFLNAPANFDPVILEREYFKDEQQFVGSFVVYDFGDVGYMRYSSFSDGISSEDLDYIIKKFKNYKGIIVDVRSNGGGSLGNATTLASRFTAERTWVAMQKEKNGPAHDDFTQATRTYISPSDGENFTGPIALLTNRRSYSATSFFTQFMRELPNVTVVGDTTGGGGGAPAFTELTNGWNLRVSTTFTTAPDGFNIEPGTPPDVQIDMSEEDIDNGKDSILEKALEILRQ